MTLKSEQSFVSIVADQILENDQKPEGFDPETEARIKKGEVEAEKLEPRTGIAQTTANSWFCFIAVLKRLKDAIGNIANSILNNRSFIENFDEHSRNVMQELDRMRHNRNLCDVTYTKEDGSSISAHKVVVSFNEKIFQVYYTV